MGAKRRQTGQPFEDQKLQQAKMARLKRENARLEEEILTNLSNTPDDLFALMTIIPSCHHHYN